MNGVVVVLIHSPNTVLANCLEGSIDLIKPRLNINKPNKVLLAVGTQINGFPHMGTYLVQAAAFVLAHEIRGQFGVDVSVEFGALDNAPYEVIQTNQGAFQIDWKHHQGIEAVKSLIVANYLGYFDELSRLTGVAYDWATYYEQQENTVFRATFLESLNHQEALKWCVSPSNGVLKVRIPCPQCGYAQKNAQDTTLVHFNEESAVFECLCHTHGKYQVTIDLFGNGSLDLNTMYRNVIKEAVYAQAKDTLSIMVKGGDWLYSTQPVDWALSALGYSTLQSPMRIFTPQVLTKTGAKLSKSLIRSGDLTMSEVPEWILDMNKFRALFPDDYAKVLVWLVKQFLQNPRHFYRSYSYDEIIRLIMSYKDTDGTLSC